MIQIFLVLLSSSFCWASNKPPLGVQRKRYQTFALFTIGETRAYMQRLLLEQRQKALRKRRVTLLTLEPLPPKVAKDDQKIAKPPYFVPPLDPKKLKAIPGYTPLS